MSNVTDLYLAHSLSEDYWEETGSDIYPIHYRINLYFGLGDGLNVVDGDKSGGTKYPQVVMLYGAFNYLDIEEFLCYIKGLAWKRPESVQVFYKGEHDVKFTLWNLNEDTD